MESKTSLYFYSFKFFTTWVLVMALFHKYVFDKVNLLFLSWMTCIVGLYFSFINPRKFVFYFEGLKYEYTGLEKFIIVDILFHVLVLIAIYQYYGAYYKSIGLGNSQTLIALVIMMIYLAMFDVKKIYGVSYYEMTAMVVVAGILYVLII